MLEKAMISIDINLFIPKSYFFKLTKIFSLDEKIKCQCTCIYMILFLYLRNDKMVAFQDGSYLMDQEFDGKGLTPYDPAHNSTYLLAGKLLTNFI